MASYESQKLLDLKKQVNNDLQTHHRRGTDIGFQHMIPHNNKYKNALHPANHLTPSKKIQKSRSTKNHLNFFQKGIIWKIFFK